MALYEKVVQLLDARPNLKKEVVPRLGELHTVMAALRALGTSIENSGIDDAWIEADVYGPATTRQILKCSHYKRALRAHVHTYTALYELLLEEFFTEMQHLKEVCSKPTNDVQEACTNTASGASDGPERVRIAHTNLIQVLINEDVIQQLKMWQNQKSSNAMFKSLMNYLHRVQTILFFVEASRNADLALHLEAGDALGKMFFALDRIKYKRLWPRYMADMCELKEKHPATWRSLEEGDISVTKSDVTFVSIGADHACEQIHREMKVQSGLLGISNNSNARQRFFLASPEISSLSTEFKGQFGLQVTKSERHHDVRPTVIRQEHEAVDKLKTAILKHGNPFAVEGEQLYNFITHAYVPQEYVPQILNVDDIGQKLYEDYVSERINGEVSLWAPVKKQNNNMYTSGNKGQTVKIRDNIVDMKETKNLHGRLMVLCRSNRDIDQKNAVGNYEFTLTPRALFAPDGTMLPCTDKSKLIHDLTKLTDTDESNERTEIPVDNQPHVGRDADAVPSAATFSTSLKIAIVDGMVLVQKMSIQHS